MDHLQEAREQVESATEASGDYLTGIAGTHAAIARAHALIAIAEMLQASIKAGTIQIDATLWNGSYPIQITEEDSL